MAHKKLPGYAGKGFESSLESIFAVVNLHCLLALASSVLTKLLGLTRKNS